MNSILKAKKINKSFDGNLTLNNVDCAIPEGKITFLFGPSGSGKSTLLNCLVGVENIDSGEIISEIDKINTLNDGNSNKFEKVYPKITSVSQDFSLWPHLTNIQNITLSKFLDKKFDVYSYANELKISKILDKYPYQCSGGEQQRVALLRHIALSPKILFLDEITSALDVEQIEILSKILLRLKNEGMTIFIVTHLLSFITNIGDYFYFMDHGKIVESGTKYDFEKPKTERLKSFLSLYSI